MYKLLGVLNDLIHSEKLLPKIESISRGQYLFSGNKIEYFRVRGEIVNDEPMMNLVKEFLIHEAIDFSNFYITNFMVESML